MGKPLPIFKALSSQESVTCSDEYLTAGPANWKLSSFSDNSHLE
jgi:hypothetical protein